MMKKFLENATAILLTFVLFYIVVTVGYTIKHPECKTGGFWARFGYVTMLIPNKIAGNIEPIDSRVLLQLRVNDMVNNIVYVKDPRTDICYAWIRDKNIFTAVPSGSVPERLLVTAYSVPPK